ncbi:MAG: hypothetical protein J6X44_07665 [Thermoguttaceae bacterium]|nr:hypothetical protein [Thermoguttaceae bacterium]
MTTGRKVFAIGTDEAGYGPNLGPLLVGASCWTIETNEPINRAPESPAVCVPTAENRPIKKKKKRAPTGPTLFDLEEESNRPQTPDLEFTRRLIDRMNAALEPIANRKGIFPLVDSKKLYASKSLAALERSFLLAVALVNPAASQNATFRSTLENVAHERGENVPPPWEEGFDLPLPVDSKTGSANDLLARLAQVQTRLDAEKIALVDLAARRVQPREFNALLDRLGLKSDLIGDVTTSLVVETIARTCGQAKEPDYIALCDKLGGRDRYAPLLAKRFPGATTSIIKESRDASVYRLIATSGRDRNGEEIAFASPVRLEIRFTAKGESNAPTALASICAKYLRELSMDAFNAYWRGQVGESLKPTAGYPVDALRFRDDVRETREKLGIPDDVFWRKK